MSNQKKYNVVFISTDQQQKQTLSCYGNDLVKTPCLDKLAKNGVVFDRAYSENPICIPARVTMITGKKSQHHGTICHNDCIRENEITLGKVLKNEGYQTYFVGKPHFGSQQHSGSIESIADWRDGTRANYDGPYAGFENIGMILGHSNPLVCHYGEWVKEKHKEASAEFICENLKPLDVNCGHGVFDNNIPEEAYSSTYVSEKSCEYIEESAKKDEPFYLFASFPDPHWPINPPGEWFHMYDDITDEQISEFIIPYNGEFKNENYPKMFTSCEEQRELYTPYAGGGEYVENKQDAYKITRAYWGAVSLIDKNVGKIMDKLEELNLTDDTLIVFTSDHGEYMGTHGMMAKRGFLWEQYISIPLIMSLPKEMKKDIRVDSLVGNVDFVPTILDYLNIDSNKMACDGFSQKAVISGEEKEARDYVLIHHPVMEENVDWADINGIVTENYKLNFYANDKNGELYDLVNDPNELNNVYNDPVYQQIKNDLIYKLLEKKIMENDKQALFDKRNADHYGQHIMKYKKWQKEYNEMGITID